jgi:hypothetical protein
MGRDAFSFHWFRRLWNLFRGSSRRRQRFSILGTCLSLLVILTCCCLLAVLAIVEAQPSGRAPSPGSGDPPAVAWAC